MHTLRYGPQAPPFMDTSPQFFFLEFVFTKILQRKHWRDFPTIFNPISGDSGVPQFEKDWYLEVPPHPGLVVWPKIWEKYEIINSQITSDPLAEQKSKFAPSNLRGGASRLRTSFI